MTEDGELEALICRIPDFRKDCGEPKYATGVLEIMQKLRNWSLLNAAYSDLA